MKTTKLSMTVMLFFAVLLGRAGGPVQCEDWNGYVASKNTGLTGAFTLTSGLQENAAQTYHYSGPGKLNQIRVEGNFPFAFGGVPLRATVYNVDANGRPTTAIESVDFNWWWFNNPAGYMDVSFGSGVYLNSNFAVSVSIRPGVAPFGLSFQLKYTGDGEGDGEDLASIAGTSTGFNWASALNSFNKDGDFYIIPQMTHFNSPGFKASASCVAANTPITFTSTSTFSRDSMFNKIGQSGYTGGVKFYSWNFGDGTTPSNMVNPVHSYGNPGRYTVSLTTSIVGWNTTCTETYSMDISVGLSSSTTSIVNVTCNGGTNGSVVAVASGGASPYTYQLGNDEPQNTTSFTGLAAGSYSLVVTDDLGCTSTSSFTITQPSTIVFNTPQTTLPSCGGTNGQILVSATGGTGLIKYRIGTGAYGNSGLFSNLTSGSYTITARDANLCTKTINVVLGNTGGPSLTVLSSTNVSCNGGNDGTITLLGSGGTGALLFSINGGTSYQATTAYTGLTAGTYSVLVKDAADCKSGATVVITQPSALSLSATTEPATCFGSNDGQIHVVDPIGGIGSLSFSVNGTSYQSGLNFSGLSSGTYTVYVRDVAQCTATTTAVVTQPTAVSATVNVMNASCNGVADGVINISGSGGNGGYSYSLDGDNFEKIGYFLNLPAGGYTVFVEDRKGCTFNTNVTVTEPAAIVGNVVTTNSTCGNNNGSILVNASGGSGSGYQFSTDGTTFSASNTISSLTSGTYYIVIRDGSGCQQVVYGTISNSDGPVISSASSTDVACNGGSDGSITVNTVTGGTGSLQYGLNGAFWQTSNSFTGLSAGNYTVMVRDANLCIGITTVQIAQPAAFVMSATTVNLNCNSVNTGSIVVSAGGGAGTLAYSINGGTSYQSSSSFGSLYAGTYNIRVRDAAGCTGTISATLTEPSAILVNTGILNVSCFGLNNGSISVLSSGGTGSKTYSLDGVTYSSTQTFNSLDGGAYTVYVKDDNGCVVQKSITLTEPTAINASGSVSNVSCAGGNNGVINMSVLGGIAPYSFNWSNGSAAEDVFNLAAGTYSGTISDANGCSVTASYTVNQPALPVIVNGTVTGSTGTDGEVDITVTGGEGPYVFSWTNGEFTEDIADLAPGTYTVEVTDANGCATSNTFTVSNLVGINEVNGLAKDIRLYPNPANNYTVIETTGTEIQQVKVYDLIGQLLFESNPENAKVVINTDMFNEGIYIVKMQLNNGFATKQLEVIR